MTDGDDHSRHRSPEELRSFIETMVDHDLVRLTVYAARLARTADWTAPQDLLQSAFLAAISGDRKCPVDVKPLIFLMGAMRSILDNERTKDSWADVIDLEDEQHQQLVVNLETPERLQERLDSILELKHALTNEFGDDERPFLVFEGRMEGMSRPEIRDLLGMQQTEFESLERRLRRFITKYFPKSRRAG
jgi:DNA-directed RNA polymerase specialized sigma24 family protein